MHHVGARASADRERITPVSRAVNVVTSAILEPIKTWGYRFAARPASLHSRTAPPSDAERITSEVRASADWNRIAAV